MGEGKVCVIDRGLCAIMCKTRLGYTACAGKALRYAGCFLSQGFAARCLLWLALCLCFLAGQRRTLFAQDQGDKQDIEEEAPSSDVELEGFADTKWDSSFAQVQEKLQNLAASGDKDLARLEILHLVIDRFILVRRNGILYRYHFYKRPSALREEPLNEEKEGQGRLFYVQIQFPLLDALLVQKKLAERYGPPSSAPSDAAQAGLYMWRLQGGRILQWTEPYKQRSFTRRVGYISSPAARKIREDYKHYFDASDRLMLEKLEL